MKILLKNDKNLKKHNKEMSVRLLNVPYKEDTKIPAKYPCVVVSHLSLGVNGYQIINEFVYEEDFK